MSKKEVVQSTIEIVKAYVTGNKISVEELPRVVTVVRDAVFALERATDKGEEKRPTPAVTVRKSVSRHRIVCLEDGKKFKSLKRHLRTAHGLSPEEYRSKWGLEERYPMVAPSYSAQRTQLAVKIGLGRYGRRSSVSRKTGEGRLTDAA
jgi:predicted transcriptional regulator